MEKPIVTVETTLGSLVLELAPEAAPQTVENFLHYVRAGYYAGLVWHRIIPKFVAQTGGYTLDGRRKPPLRPALRFERSPLKHEDGSLGMARGQEMSSATTEFYLCDGPQRDLDEKYCVFGRLLDGRDVLRRIVSVPTRSDDWPTEPPLVLRAYEGKPDPANPAKAFVPPTKDAPPNADAVRVAARRLRGRAALFKSRRPLTSMGDVENAIALADRTGRQEDLERAERMLAEKEKK